VTEEDAYLLDLCDAAMGERALRDEELPWLREGADPEGRPARVDAWYPGARVIVLLTDRREEDRPRELAALAAPYGVDLLELPRGWVARDSAGALRRLPGERDRVAGILGSPEDRADNRVWVEYGYVATVGEDPEEPDWEDEDEDEGAEPASPEFAMGTAGALGWRGHAVALALLEAVRISRRAFDVDRAGDGLTQSALEALLLLVAAGPPAGPSLAATPQDFEQVIGRPREEVDDALAELCAADYAAPLEVDPEPDADDSWVLTPSGREAAVRWIARVVPLFAGWPPETPAVDDADAEPQW